MPKEKEQTMEIDWTFKLFNMDHWKRFVNLFIFHSSQEKKLKRKGSGNNNHMREEFNS